MQFAAAISRMIASVISRRGSRQGPPVRVRNTFDSIKMLSRVGFLTLLATTSYWAVRDEVSQQVLVPIVLPRVRRHFIA